MDFQDYYYRILIQPGNGNHTTCKNADDWGMTRLFLVGGLWGKWQLAEFGMFVPQKHGPVGRFSFFSTEKWESDVNKLDDVHHPDSHLVPIGWLLGDVPGHPPNKLSGNS
jgi:hypothetical protein